MKIREGLSFDDVLLVPKYSAVFKEEINLETQLTPKIRLKIPLIASPMDTVCESKMAAGLAQAGGLGIIHRNLSVSEQAAQIKRVKQTKVSSKEALLDQKGRLVVGAAVGVGSELFLRLEALLAAGADLICLDSAHGHARYLIEATKTIKRKYPQIGLVSGNVGSGEGFKRLAAAGADAIRVGVGPGSICTTRIVSGVGVPQLSAIMDCAVWSRKTGVSLIADGGIQQSGDIVKALAAGAGSVMIGSLFARLEEAPGRVVTIKGKKYKYYRGMGSLAAMRRGSASRYGQLAHAKRLIAEGVEGLVPYKGCLADFLFQLVGGLRVGMEYLGAADLASLWQRAEFIKITRSGLMESHPHDILITNGGESYNYKIQ